MLQKLDINYYNLYSCDIDGQSYYNKCKEAFIKRNEYLNNNYYICLDKQDKTWKYCIYLSLHDVKCKDVLIYKNNKRLLKEAQQDIKTYIIQHDKQITFEEWKQQNKSYCFDKDLKFLGLSYNNLRSDSIFNYYNAYPIADHTMVKWEYLPTKRYLWKYTFGSWGYSGEGVADEILKTKIEQIIRDLKV